MKYKKGDILVCSTNKSPTTGYNLVVGDKYEIIDDPNDWETYTNPNDFSKITLNVKNIKTGKVHNWIPDRLFIPLDVYREFKLKQIID